MCAAGGENGSIIESNYHLETRAALVNSYLPIHTVYNLERIIKGVPKLWQYIRQLWDRFTRRTLWLPSNDFVLTLATIAATQRCEAVKLE
jgi:hypothetical protein